MGMGDVGEDQNFQKEIANGAVPGKSELDRTGFPFRIPYREVRLERGIAQSGLRGNTNPEARSKSWLAEGGIQRRDHLWSEGVIPSRNAGSFDHPGTASQSNPLPEPDR